MPEEIELKLALGRTGAAQLMAHPALAEQPARHEALTNLYYDTPEGALEAQRIALRIRRTPERTLQTLKTAGQGSGGLSTRGEWEWEINDDGLDLEGLMQLPPMQLLGRETLQALEPRLATDFERHSWLFEYADATIEVALDQGEIRAGGRHTPINELELELKRGEPGALWQLAIQFADQVPLRPANASKAARGAALRAGKWSLAEPGDTTPAPRFDHAIACLDALTDSGDERFRHQARAILDTLARQLAHTEAAEHARALARLLSGPEWLTPAFGRHSLALQIALQRA